MLIEKEVIRPGVYFYTDERTGLPRKLTVTPEMTRYWNEQGNKMIGFGLTIPVPYEHDFNSHPMTPKDKLLNNAGEVKEYRMKGDTLFSAVDVQDPEVKNKIGHSIRWTSPWFNSFTDGDGREWKNVISHLALTTRPRITKQEPFGSIAAALSMATEIKATSPDVMPTESAGFCLSRAGRLFVGKKTQQLRPRYPMAFSMWGGGIKLGDGDMPPEPKKKKKGKPPEGAAQETEEDSDGDWDGDLPEEESSDALNGTPVDKAGGTSPAAKPAGAMNPLMDAGGDVEMEELLCDLLQALGVPMPDESNEHEFKRHLYEAVMSKIKELTSKGMGKADGSDQTTPDQNQPPAQQPNASKPNPLIQQESQPMFMSLEDINKITEPTMKNIALSMYNENVKIRAEADVDRKKLASLNDAKLKEENTKREQRVFMLGRVSPKVKADLEAMLALPSMALSMGDGGSVTDPMAQTLAVLEKGLSDLPALLTTERTALSIAGQPQDADMLTEERTNELSDTLARQMGCPPKKKAS